ncbi:MAG: hypothetical protein ACYS47_00125 [Planctomycetota bacterium]|jgi:hypothetical protein
MAEEEYEPMGEENPPSPPPGDIAERQDTLDTLVEGFSELEGRLESLRNELRNLDPAGADPKRALKNLLRLRETRELLDAAAKHSAEEAIKASFDHRLDRIEEEVQKELEVASRDILAQVKGSLEGKVLASVHEATSSKEFGNVLRSIAQDAAQQVIEGATEPIQARVLGDIEGSLQDRIRIAMSEAMGEVESLIGQNLDRFTLTDEFHDAVTTLAGPMIEEQAQGTAQGPDEDAVREIAARALEEGLSSIAQRMEALEQARAEGGEAAGAVSADEVRAAVEEDLEDIRKKLSRVQQSLVEGGGGEGDGVSIEVVKDALKGDLETLAARIGTLEQSPPSGGGADVEALQALAARLETLEQAPSLDGGMTAETMRQVLEEQLRPFVARLEILEQAPPGEGGGISEGAVKDLIKKSVREALNAVKGMIKKIEPAVEAVVEKRLEKRLQQVPTKQEVSELIERVAESLPAGGGGGAVDSGSLKGEILEALKPEVAGLAREAAASAMGSFDAPDMLKNMLDKESIEKTIRDIIESDLFSTFLNSDEMKELLDDKFKIMRNWLKNDEIPRQVKKLTGQA